ncbi:4-hydroxy-3-polyprenylbenzoate decarboxylase [Bryocella elongata]|uniref:Flavin prenyltransferase UbiX n=1 Tax=Bryocella elongata TaxID=863522 RepID=A0A1H5SDV3_9BACT|nr:UbiX family flavin prenyltransferase [Bryocella elongata]SEF48675.1 4-hydroxy-3-polyprenylbenzoate decarboxylase [Bryocella elongata]
MELTHSYRKPGQTIVTLAITGASGAALAAEALRALEADARVARVHLVASPSALRVLAEETGISGRIDLAEKLAGHPCPKVLQHAHEDVGAAIASGSYPIDAMIVIPCSMGTLAGIAHGLASNLIERAADVCLKERRKLVLCVRETPLNLIHLRNMTAVAEAGATVFPVVPAFYAKPQSMEEMVRTYVQRVLAHIGLEQSDAYVWGSE